MNDRRLKRLSAAQVGNASCWLGIALLVACTAPRSHESPEGSPSGGGFSAGATGGTDAGGMYSGGQLTGGAGGAGASGGSGGTGTGAAGAGGMPMPVPGFQAEYFFQYRELSHSEVVPSIDYVWQDDSAEPAEGVGEDRFSARYTATLQVPVAGNYAFATNADDGVRLWVNDQLVIDDWRPHAPERHEGSIELPSGEVPLRLEYFEVNYGAALSLYWTPPGGTESLLDENAVTAAAGLPEGPKPPYRNAVLAANRPDPGVLADGNPPVYYMLTTGGKFPIRRSYDLVLWEYTEKTVLPDGKPAWAANGNRNWAPEMHRVADKYVVYYTAANGSNVLSIGAAYADNPTGPYTDIGHPLVEHEYGVIDASYFRDKDGKHYLTYKIDGNAAKQPTPIYLRELAPDGLSFAEGSSQVELIRNDSATWEGGVVEAQWLIERDGTYFLFYSGNVYDHRYRTGVARANSVKGPYTKHGDPILTNNDSWVGPGHGSVVPAGNDLYFVYHAWVENGSGGREQGLGRQVLVDKITFVDNWPVIHNGSPSTGLMPWPGSE